MSGGRALTVAFALLMSLALAGGIRPGAAAQPDQASSSLSPEADLPLVKPQLLALADDLDDRRVPPARSRLGRPRAGQPLGPAPRRFERGPRMCLVAQRCPSEPCIQFVARNGRHGPACDRFPDPADARMLPLARP